MRKRIIPYLKGGAVTAAIVLLLPLVTPQLNGQIAVFDGSSWASLGKIWQEDISNGAKLIQEYNELVKIWTSGMQIYNLRHVNGSEFHDRPERCVDDHRADGHQRFHQRQIRRDHSLATDDQWPTRTDTASLGDSNLSAHA